MSDLKNIGFYTLDDKRAESSNTNTPLYRCELILTDACNLKCVYCRNLSSDNSGTKKFEEAKAIVDLWASEGIRNIRFSGGECTILPYLLDLVKYTKKVCKDIQHIAISTNGLADISLYRDLIDAGVNDYSISLDACCASYAKAMSGVDTLNWDQLVSNIKDLSALTYVTVGVVVTETTINQLPDVIKFADSLGVSDIRIISAAQFNKVLDVVKDLDDTIVNKYPILKFRVNNIRNGINVRGLGESDSHKCGLVLDDIAIAGKFHYPCIIYLRENGNYIGEVGPNMRKEREEWYKTHDSLKDPICAKNCLDVCKMFNNLHEKHYKV